MRRLIGILFICLIGFQALAQVSTIKPESLFDTTRQNYQSSGLYRGTPFVKFGATVGAPVPEAKSGWMDEEKKRLFGTTQITQDKFFQSNAKMPAAFKPSAADLLTEITFKTPFGKETNAVFVPHTTDFISMIQVLDEKSIAVEEIIQYIQTENQPFERVLSLPKDEKLTSDSFQLIRAIKDGKPFDLNVQITDNEIILSNDTVLPAGIYQFQIKYIIQSGIDIQNGNGLLNYNITGYKWPLPINRFIVYVSFPAKTTIFNNNLAFGANDVVISNSYTYNEDSHGNSFFQLKNPLPSYAAVKLYQTFRSTIYTDSAFDLFFNKHINLIIVLLIISAVMVYLFVSIIYLRFKKPESDTLKFIQSLRPETLAFATTGTLSQQFLKGLNDYVKWVKQGKKSRKRRPIKDTKLYRLSQSRFWGWGVRQMVCFCLYLRLAGKYWLTVICMICGIIYLASQQNIHLTFMEYFFTFILSGIMVIVFFQKWGKQDLLKEINLYRNKLTQSYDFYGLTSQSVTNLFTRHHPRMLAINADNEWIKKTITYSSEINNLPFISKNMNGAKHEKTN